MPSRKIKPEEYEWLKSPWTKLTGVIAAIGLCIGTGHTLGKYQSEINYRIEKMEIKQEYNISLQKQINDCKEDRMKRDYESIAEIKKVVKELQKGNYEK
jgi:hypothetical protein